MMGTFAAMLAKRRIPTPKNRYHADVSGDIEAVDGVLKIVRIKAHYTLKIAADKRGEAEAAFEEYLLHCPAAQSVINAIEISHAINFKTTG